MEIMMSFYRYKTVSYGLYPPTMASNYLFRLYEGLTLIIPRKIASYAIL